MGYDKPDLELRRPLPVAWLAGRATTSRSAGPGGRSSRAAACCCAASKTNRSRTTSSSVPSPPSISSTTSSQPSTRYDGPVSLIRIQNGQHQDGELELVVKQLDVDGVLERVAGRSYERTLQPWTYPAEPGRRRHRRPPAEQQAMVDYFHTTGCRMRFLANLLDDPSGDDCGICDNCTGARARSTSRRAGGRGRGVPAKRRPARDRRKKMYVDPELEPAKRSPTTNGSKGRALAMWGDCRLGPARAGGQAQHGTFDDRLVDALADLVGDWAPDPAPTWVTSVPSLRYPELVPRFAERLAARLGLPHLPVVTRVTERPPQRSSRTRPTSSTTSRARSRSPGRCPTARCCSSTTSSTRPGR